MTNTMMKKRLSELKKKIVIIAQKEVTMNKPLIRGFSIKQAMIVGETHLSYEIAFFELVDDYTCPITKKQKQDVYKCSFEGKLTVIPA